MPFLRIEDIWYPENQDVSPRRVEDINGRDVSYSEKKLNRKTFHMETSYKDFFRWIMKTNASVKREGFQESAENKYSPSQVLGKKIAHVRKEHGMTQDDLARALEVSRSAVALMETGRSCRARNNISKISEIFDIEPEFFLCAGEQRKAVKISEDEQTLLVMYRTLSTPEKIDAQQYMERRIKK